MSATLKEHTASFLQQIVDATHKGEDITLTFPLTHQLQSIRVAFPKTLAIQLGLTSEYFSIKRHPKHPTFGALFVFYGSMRPTLNGRFLTKEKEILFDTITSRYEELYNPTYLEVLEAKQRSGKGVIIMNASKLSSDELSQLDAIQQRNGTYIVI